MVTSFKQITCSLAILLVLTLHPHFSTFLPKFRDLFFTSYITEYGIWKYLIQKYIKKSFKESAQFRLWNPIISREINDSDKDDIAEKRIINMLTSDEPKLHRAAAVIASREHIYTQGVAKQMNDYVQQNFANSEVRTDTLLYCIDVIEKSEYKDAMQTMKLVSLSASSAKLSSAARRAYNKLKRI